MRPFLCTSNYSQRIIRTVTAGFIDSTGPISSLKINGVTTPDNSTDIALSTWASLEFNYNSPFMPIDNIGRRPTLQGFSGRLASVVFSSGGSAIGSYAIDDNNGSVIADGSGNGYNATLDIGSGSWILDWVPLN